MMNTVNIFGSTKNCLEPVLLLLSFYLLFLGEKGKGERITSLSNIFSFKIVTKDTTIFLYLNLKSDTTLEIQKTKKIL